MRTCRVCKQDKEESEFSKDKQYLKFAPYDGLSTRCKECAKKANKKYWSENSEKVSLKRCKPRIERSERRIATVLSEAPTRYHVRVSDVLFHMRGHSKGRSSCRELVRFTAEVVEGML